nr:monodehydroascorbate reductase [Tanacetum cinerariifolium]
MTDYQLANIFTKALPRQRFEFILSRLDTMADVNVNAPAGQAPAMAPPVHTDDQILPRIRWVPIGKRNCYLDLDKLQSNPIYKITMDLLKHTNFFRAFTASSTIHLIYIQNLSNVVTNDMFQPWRELTTIINLCLTGKTSRFERPRAPVLQILWGIVTRAHIDYAKRIWEEFTQSIHTFIDDKRNLTQHTLGKKKATLIVIPSIRFTKLIIHHLQRRHKFHPRPDSPLHFPNKEPVLGYLKFSANGTKREVFGMPIPGSLITTDIQEALYYQEYLAKVDAKDADMQKALEESLKSMYDVPRGPLPPVVIREPKLGKYQPLLEVPGKGKAKAGPDLGAQAEGQAGPDPGAQDEGQARSNPEEQSEGHAGPDPSNAGADEQSMPSPVVHAGSDPKHMDLDVSDVSPQPSTEQMDEGDKPLEADNDKATTETEVESMVSVTIQQDMSSIPPMTSLIIFLTSRPESPKVHQQLKAIATETTTTTTLPPPPYQQQSTAEAMMMKRIGELEHVMANLIQENKGLEERDLPEADMKEILHQRMWETKSYKSHEDHMQLYEALEKSMNRDHSKELSKDLAEARKKKKNSRESPKTPPGSPPHQPPPPPSPAGPSGALGAPGAFGSSQVSPPPPPHSSTNQEGQSKGSATLSSLKTAASAEYQAWTTTDIRLRPSISLTPADLQMDEDMAPDEQAHSSNNEDIGSAHIPKVNLRQDWWKPLEEERPATPEPAWSISSSDVPALHLKSSVFHPDVIHLQYQMEECHKLLTDSVDDSILRHNVSKPLPLGGPPGQVTIQSDFFFNKDLEYLRYDSKGSRPTLSISKMKAAYYPDVGLEQMVPHQFWIKEECKYDIAAMYGISHWWFQRQRFYIDRHTSEGDRSAVWTHMRILGVVIIEVFSMYGYDYMKKIVLHHANLNEHVIVERDFKYLYPGLNTRFWTRKDVDRSNAFMFIIQKQLKTRRIFCNLESFVGGRVRDGDYRLLKRTE